jgi:hypothetical protein
MSLMCLGVRGLYTVLKTYPPPVPPLVVCFPPHVIRTIILWAPFCLHFPFPYPSYCHVPSIFPLFFFLSFTFTPLFTHVLQESRPIFPPGGKGLYFPDTCFYIASVFCSWYAFDESSVLCLRIGGGILTVWPSCSLLEVCVLNFCDSPLANLLPW